MTYRVRNFLRLFAGLFVPHTAVVAAKAIARRRRKSRSLESHSMVIDPVERSRKFSYEEAVSFLVGRGLDEHAVRLGSIDARSMRFAEDLIVRHAPERPLTALHVGNFVGLSLAALSDLLARRRPDSVVVSIDPNLPHLGVVDPQSHALAVLGHFGLQESNVLICGYSLGKSIGSDGLIGADGYDPVASFRRESACEHTLGSLKRLGQRFDVALIDGNHDTGYLREEIEMIVGMLGEPGLLILDDVSRAHEAVRELFTELATDDAWPLEKVGQNERLGALRKCPEGVS